MPADSAATARLCGDTAAVRGSDTCPAGNSELSCTGGLVTFTGNHVNYILISEFVSSITFCLEFKKYVKDVYKKN